VSAIIRAVLVLGILVAAPAEAADRTYKDWDEFIKDNPIGPPTLTAAEAAQAAAYGISTEAALAHKTKDYRTLIRALRPLVEQGNPKAQELFGDLYEKGHGVPQDYAEAMRWYRSAAEKGSADAMGCLGQMAVGGRGMPQNYVQAHMWFNLAHARDPRFWGDWRDEVVASKMTPEQIGEAQRLAGEWVSKHPFPESPWPPGTSNPGAAP
jgi:TPR repeat protein